MNRKILFTVAVAGFLMAACDSGDINIQPQTTVQDSNNTVNEGGGGTTNPCASISIGGSPVQGSFDGQNCTYPDVVGAGNNLLTDLFLPALDNGGAHIFEGSLFVGETCNTDACLMNNGIAEGGDGPTLTVEAGATLAWRTNSDFLIVNRGSQIIARGRADAPITLTSVSDVNGSVGPEDVQQWGGVVINGFGVTNDCAYTGTRGVDLALSGECHVDSEGSAGLDENQHGGDNDADNSGVLSYVVVKHTGAQVGNGDELNGITFAAVGRGTQVDNLQVYSTFDDGIEMFGGSFDIDNFVALYVRDDSIDLDAGWQGTITDALVVQSETIGNHCIESDGIASYDDLTTPVREDFVNRGLNTRVTISNLTCIVSPTATQGDFDPGAGWRFREGIWFNVSDSVVITSFAPNTGGAGDNYCLRIEDDETVASAVNGDSSLTSVAYACQVNAEGTTIGGFADEQAYAEDQGNQFATVADGTAVSATAANDPDLQLLEGTVPVFSIDFATALIDGAAPTVTPAPTSGYLGGLSLGSTDADWTSPWAFGIDPANRAQALWFETL